MEKTFKCKKCGVEKPISEFYAHPETKDGIVHKCKPCYKAGQVGEKSRAYDRKRYHNDPKRNKYIKDSSDRRGKERHYKHIHLRSSRRIKKLGLRPDTCPICGNHKSVSRIEAHHYDYNKWNEIIFCCSICHSKLDQKKIDYKNCIITNIQLPNKTMV